ncbi:MAG: protocatechuate 3,4-dioxygenase subunit alpha [Saprospiraceae bacterium]|nr:protocatechuate 3,4-dioxygenase subunit alpha [Saprospiraceae bacterium]
MDPLNNPIHQTPSQTVGPYFAYGLTAEQYGYPFSSLNNGEMVPENFPGQHIILKGKIFDGENQPIPDAMIELWQADHCGNYLGGKDSIQNLFGRQGTGTLESCEYIFQTIKPGPVGDQAPHINVILFMRGQLSHVYTRIYFKEFERLNTKDDVWISVPPDRRSTLLTVKTIENNKEIHQFDIYMQGEKETVFFDV